MSYREVPITEGSPQLWPVVELASGREAAWPWTISDRPSFSFIRLGQTMSDGDIGSVFAQLVEYNGIEGRDLAALQTAILEAESLILPGGLQASLGHQQISPSCCCGLEGWREWEDVLEGGFLWLGHDPAPWVELSSDVVRVWSDGTSDAFAIAFERRRFERELARASEELRAFLRRANAWARTAGFGDAEAVCRKLDACFAISSPHETRPHAARATSRT